MRPCSALIRRSVPIYQKQWHRSRTITSCCRAAPKLPQSSRQLFSKMEGSTSTAVVAADNLKVTDYWVPRAQRQVEAPLQSPYEKLEKLVLEIVEHGIGAAGASQLVKQNLRVEGNTLYVRGQRYNLHRNVHVIAFGKAVLGMARAVDDLLADHIVRGIAIVPNGTQNRAQEVEQEMANSSTDGKHRKSFLLRSNSRIRVMEGAQDNMIDEAAMHAAMEAMKLAHSLRDNDILLVLVTGGGSALLPLPVTAITLEEKREITRLLSMSGADIYDLNTVRKQFSQLKGGKLAAIAERAKIISLVLSDVVGDLLEYVASGPTVIDGSESASHALDIISKYDLLKRMPPRAIAYLEQKAAQESSVLEARSLKGSSSGITALLEGHGGGNNDLGTSARGGAGAGEDARTASGTEQRETHSEPSASTVQNVLIGNNRLALKGAEHYARHVLGCETYILGSGLRSGVEKAAELFSKLCNFMQCSGLRDDSGEMARILSLTEFDLVRSGLKKEQLNEVLTASNTAFTLGRPLCILAGGELTVNMKSDKQNFAVGKGGRCMHLSMLMAKELYELKQRTSSTNKLRKSRLAFEFCAVGTDGRDGPTDGAGAFINPLTLTSGITADHDEDSILQECNAAIENFDSFTWLKKHANGRYLLRYPFTDTNVMDLFVLLVTRYDVTD